MIRDVIIQDACKLCAIYNHYVSHTIVTFEEECVTVSEMESRIAEFSGEYPWLVCTDGAGDDVCGFAYASPWKSRCAYQFTAETTIYLAENAIGYGYGITLYLELLKRVSAIGLHTAIGIIALPNDASIALHQKCGYTQVGQLREVGFKFGEWIDVGYWEIVFD